ncbi:predicted protein [Histoplasma mississippiense (nom. inval.)]|uniref:predicted protein n=1 Tax=Ajellomyces capsulatus (strain NAm1 / WU24) TaxID=2059318 RepID=UPI000157D356|nr:predicted protein [Histoplasma mississippiense (nom. inval.)]EDN04663.1 predicted protein [Histoplasma mississippiense (nom. inval.)]
MRVAGTAKSDQVEDARSKEPKGANWQARGDESEMRSIEASILMSDPEPSGEWNVGKRGLGGERRERLIRRLNEHYMIDVQGLAMEGWRGKSED